MTQGLSCNTQTSQQTQFLAPTSEAPLMLLSLLPGPKRCSVTGLPHIPSDPPLLSFRNPIPSSSPEHASTPATKNPSPKLVLRQNEAPYRHLKPRFSLAISCHGRVEHSSVPAQPPSSQQCPWGRWGEGGKSRLCDSYIKTALVRLEYRLCQHRWRVSSNAQL